jgi:6-phosphogluconate dehydrogenase
MTTTPGAEKQQFGIVGLGLMGQNLALNLASRGFSIAGFDLEAKQADVFAAKTAGRSIVTCRTQVEFLGCLAKPRRMLVMVPAGPPVDAVIATLRPRLRRGDLLIDGGHSWFLDTVRRIRELEGTGILYIGAGITGGEEGALRGPAIMPGGTPEAWPLVRPILQAMAAKAEDGTPCCEWIGSGGSGHFVKMVHNAIEYADMQMIADAYWLLARLLELPAEEIARIFAVWNDGELGSYLVGITATILARRDAETNAPLVDVILDAAGQSDAGKWAGQVSLELGVAAPTIADAVFARTLSSLKRERVAAAALLPGPSPAFTGDRDEFVEKVRKALYCSKICSYAQGFQLLHAADQQHGWGLKLGTIASLWRAGSIVRARCLDTIMQAYAQAPALPNLLLDAAFASTMASYQEAWRQIVALAAANGVPVPGFMSALGYYDGYRSPHLPANLMQAQRDYFGAHHYRRIDRDGIFHTSWFD